MKSILSLGKMKNWSGKTEHLPDKPGVYLMKNSQGETIYVGKARSLKKRVRSYFQSPHGLAPKVGRLRSNMADFEYIITDSEIEALILECNLIKTEHPRYNVRLGDDKKYPFVKLTNEDYPCLFMTRNLKADGSKYYGPYTNVKLLRKTLRSMRELFPLRSCQRKIGPGLKRPCLNYDLKQCLAPCSGQVGKEEYQNLVKSACLFLEGHRQELIKELKRRMEEASRHLRFEEASRWRDRITAIEKVTERQKITVWGGGDQDYIAFAKQGDQACVNVFLVREGKGIGQEHFFLQGVKEASAGEILSNFLKQYYSRLCAFPEEIVLPGRIDERDLISHWLEERRGGKISLSFPQRGRKRQLLEMVQGNAQVRMEEVAKGSQGARESAAAQLQKLLHLSSPPHRMEAFDVSNIFGREAVGSMVVFQRGEPKKSDYRHFKIKLPSAVPARQVRLGGAGGDDYAMIKEIVGRRYGRVLEEKGRLPDLILIDGGKGHLNSALDVLTNLGLERIPVMAIAKQFEQVFIKDSSRPINLSSNSQLLCLIQAIRDEAHRFAIKFHRGLRQKKLREYTPFQRRVWEVVKTIPSGQTRSYKWVAERLGNPKAARAVGQALKKNPLPGIIPCHRVIRSNGSQGGFSQGSRRKRSLLHSEGVG